MTKYRACEDTVTFIRQRVIARGVRHSGYSGTMQGVNDRKQLTISPNTRFSTDSSSVTRRVSYTNTTDSKKPVSRTSRWFRPGRVCCRGRVSGCEYGCVGMPIPLTKFVPSVVFHLSIMLHRMANSAAQMTASLRTPLRLEF